ncbi:MAG: hypothetical protein JSV03_01225, partial [Planctomycetota bacterium]
MNRRFKLARVTTVMFCFAAVLPAGERIYAQRVSSEGTSERSAGSEHAAEARTKPESPKSVGYQEAFVDLYKQLGRYYPCFELKGIDWQAVGEEMLPRVNQIDTDREFGLLCLQLVARLEDSHAWVQKGSAELPELPIPRWDPGLACLLDDRNKPVVYYLDQDGPAERAGVKKGMTVLSINGKPAESAINECMEQISKYTGYSSKRYLKYQAVRRFARQMHKGANVVLEMEGLDGNKSTFKLPATLGNRYLPRLPVPIKGIT